MKLWIILSGVNNHTKLVLVGSKRHTDQKVQPDTAKLDCSIYYLAPYLPFHFSPVLSVFLFCFWNAEHLLRC